MREFVVGTQVRVPVLSFAKPRRILRSAATPMTETAEDLATAKKTLLNRIDLGLTMT